MQRKKVDASELSLGCKAEWRRAEPERQKAELESEAAGERFAKNMGIGAD
jgi:hypothetical protein